MTNHEVSHTNLKSNLRLRLLSLSFCNEIRLMKSIRQHKSYEKYV